MAVTYLRKKSITEVLVVSTCATVLSSIINHISETFLYIASISPSLPFLLLAAVILLTQLKHQTEYIRIASGSFAYPSLFTFDAKYVCHKCISFQILSLSNNENTLYLSNSSEYNMTNIFWFSHILSNLGEWDNIKICETRQVFAIFYKMNVR